MFYRWNRPKIAFRNRFICTDSVPEFDIFCNGDKWDSQWIGKFLKKKDILTIVNTYVARPYLGLPPSMFWYKDTIEKPAILSSFYI